MSKFGCHHNYDDNRIFWLSAFSFQCGPCSKQSPAYGSNPGSFADDRIHLIIHFKFGPCSKQSPEYGSNPRIV